MKDPQNKFYSSISAHYAEIFPYKPMQMQFVKNRAGELNGKRILDIGCATGELAFHLAESGANVTGIDLNEDLLVQAKQKIGSFQTIKINFQPGNMLHLESDFRAGQFDTVLCFGNTLVHLASEKLVLQMLKGVFNVLKSGGQFLLQILNYDYILDEPVTELPLIETENIRFIRNYVVEENHPVIRFQTELILKNEGKSVKNDSPLLALRSNELKTLLEESGFKNIELFSNFKEEPFGGNHLPLVVYATK
jgi:2-polyprenyl-3-methyl-5-hydroxy-6-metoxy-1,4-benzoquinol methylase